MNYWGKKMVFDLDEEVELVIQGDNITSPSIMLLAISRKMVQKGIQCYYRCREGSSLIKPSPNSQRKHRL